MNKAKEENKKAYRKNWVALTARSIPYYPVLRQITGSVTAAILMQQLEYWFSVMRGEPFYKYMSMPEGKYARGKKESNWVNELDFSEDEFRTAFDKIGIRYKSKKAFTEATDKFQGKMYLSYYEKTSHLTWYHRNQQLIQANLAKLETSISKGNKQNQSDKTDISNVDNKQKSKSENKEESTSHTPPSPGAGGSGSDTSSYKENNSNGNGYSDKSSLNGGQPTDEPVQPQNEASSFPLDTPLENAPLVAVKAVYDYYQHVFGKKVPPITLTSNRIEKTKKLLKDFSCHDFKTVIDTAWDSDFYRGEEEDYDLMRKAGVLTFDQLINSYEQFENILNQANYIDTENAYEK